MFRLKPIITYAVAYFFTASTFLRNAQGWEGRPTHPSSICLLIGFVLLLIIEPLLTRRSHKLTHLYLGAQTIIVALLLYFPPHADYFSVLFVPLSLQAVYVFKPKIGFSWIGIFTIVMAGLTLYGFGLKSGLPFILNYMIVNFGIGGLLLITNNAEAAHKKIQEQQDELLKTQEALRQSEMEKAITAERSRLARELHDSVTQSLHSATLMAEAGQRLAGAGDIERARGYLVRLGEISQQALREMRLLVYELRPLELSGNGLAGALQQRLDAVERRSGMEVKLSIEEHLELPEKIEEELFRIAMEALNNALKHASPSKVTVILQKVVDHEIPCIELTIKDDGVGFDPESKDDEGGLGLISMQQRIEKLGGELIILSAPDEGTQVKVCVNLEK